ncbi:MoaD/ThiS family protein [Vreelandella olivaria]|uniref:MoaD/ThiS family protein n=1 Tax=Vreelandella olivaria TaxID=390919 RepID=UPI00201F5068|nr:MoaD/ThiS family protein [Halomonas olivaria]
MPLTQVTNYLNERLQAFNPHASLRHHAAFHWEDGQIWGRLANLMLYPSQQPIFSLERLDVAAWEAGVEIRDQHDRPHQADWLYFLSWNQEDVVFLDRFLRVLHALNHLAQHGASTKPLIVDVHWRHIQAVEASHGSVFESLLTQLGLHPRQVVLRLDGQVVLGEAHARAAAQSFQKRGYPLLAQGIPLGASASEWQRLQQSGVHWVTPTSDTLPLARKSREYFPRLVQWSRDAQQAGLDVWWPDVDHPGDLGIMTQLEPTLVSGQQLTSFELPAASRLG